MAINRKVGDKTEEGVLWACVTVKTNKVKKKKKRKESTTKIYFESVSLENPHPFSFKLCSIVSIKSDVIPLPL